MIVRVRSLLWMCRECETIFVFSLWTRVFVFIWWRISGLRATKRDLNGSEFIPDDLVACWAAHVPLLGRLAGSGKQYRKQWPYLGGESHCISRCAASLKPVTSSGMDGDKCSDFKSNIRNRFRGWYHRLSISRFRPSSHALSELSTSTVSCRQSFAVGNATWRSTADLAA